MGNLSATQSNVQPIRDFLVHNNGLDDHVVRLFTDIESHSIPDVWLANLLVQMQAYAHLPTRSHIWKFMLESLQYVLMHPHVIQPIEEYSFHLFNMNRKLDDYCDPKSSVHKNKSWLQANSNDIVFHDSDNSFLKWLRAESYTRKTYEYTQELLNMFYRHDLPKISKHVRLYRCVMLYDDTREAMTKDELVNYRITSTSLAESYFSCPWSNVPRWDQLLHLESDCSALFIGFMSLIPSQDEVIFGPNLQFTKRSRLNKKQIHELKTYLEHGTNLPEAAYFYNLKQLVY